MFKPPPHTKFLTGPCRGGHTSDDAVRRGESTNQQAMLMLHRVRELLVRQRTMLATALRAHLAEFGIVAPQGIHRVEKLAAEVHDPAVPVEAREVLMLLVDELSSVWRRIEALEALLKPSTVPTQSAGGSLRSQAWDHLRPWRSPAPCRIRPCSGRAASSPPGWASRPRAIRAAANGPNRLGLDDARSDIPLVRGRSGIAASRRRAPQVARAKVR